MVKVYKSISYEAETKGAMSVLASPLSSRRSNMELFADEFVLTSEGGLGALASVPVVPTVGLRVLIVEDSTTQRKLLARRLKECNDSWTVTAVRDATECIAHLRERGFDNVDVLLVDMQLGEEMTGSDLVCELRTTYGMQRQVFIGLNRDRDAIEIRFMTSGADAAWSKPVPTVDVINLRILQLLQARAILQLVVSNEEISHPTTQN